MIPHRFARILGAVLLLAPSIAFAQSSLQQPVASGSRPDTMPTAFSKLYGNDLFLQGLIASRFSALGAAALLNVGSVTGTVADGGALSAEALRAKAAEQANTAGIATNATAIATETSRAQGVEALKAPIASPAFTGAPTAPTAPAGSSGTQIANMAAVVAAVAAGGGGSSGGVPTSRNVNAAGLATGGGPLSSDVTITVPAAAQSDVATGTDQTKALTSFSVAAALGAKAPLASPAFVGAATFASGSAQYATAISILPSTFTTSRRSALSFGDWALVQDASGNGTKDFGIYNGPIGSFPIYINTTGIVAFNQPPTAPTPSVGDNTTKLATTAFATALAVPSGAVMHFAMSSCPAAWLKANSAAVSRSTYSGLFAAIGTTFGAGDGSTTFNLPDLRGEFIRGFDDGRGVDSGRALGSFQAQQIQNHTHNTSYDVVAAAGSGARAPSDNFNNVSATSNPTSGGGTETRPRNVALLACIKS